MRLFSTPTHGERCCLTGIPFLWVLLLLAASGCVDKTIEQSGQLGPVIDTGKKVDTNSGLNADSDTATVTDSGHTNSSDSATTTDAQPDTSSATDSGTNTAVDSDSATGSDTATTAVPDSDTATGIDSETITTPDSDTATSIDSDTATVPDSDSDTGTGAEDICDWAYPDAAASDVFVSHWETGQPGVTASNQVRLPLVENGTYDFTVEWGDGTSDVITQWDAAEATHNYLCDSVFEVRISGTISGWRFPPTDQHAEEMLEVTGAVEYPDWILDDSYLADEYKLIDVSQWGGLALGDTRFQFFNTRNLDITASDAPDLTGTTSLRGALAFSGMLIDSPTAAEGMSQWETSGITDMSYMFSYATTFDEDISGWGTESWDTSNVTDMSHMFFYASRFNKPLGNWDTSRVTNMKAMFQEARNFNGNRSAGDPFISFEKYG